MIYADVEANELEMDGEKEGDVSSWFEFRIDASSVGNVARWINHPRSGANLEARLSRDAASPDAHEWKVSFYATRDISPGEPLWWGYIRSRSVRKRAPTYDQGGPPLARSCPR